METNNKLREALIKIRDLTEPCEGVTEVELIINDIAISALAAPPRNCDVGTAEEQYARWRAFCDAQELCRECKVYRAADVCASKSRCNLTWAQMPYEAEEGGAK